MHCFLLGISLVYLDLTHSLPLSLSLSPSPSLSLSLWKYMCNAYYYRLTAEWRALSRTALFLGLTGSVAATRNIYPRKASERALSW